MYKAVFQNSKVALLFAGMTLFSAVSMIGTSEDQGVLPEAAQRIEAQRRNDSPGAQAFAASEGQGDTAPAGNSIFGEWSDDTASPNSNGYQPPMQDEDADSTVIELDSDGVTVPRER